MKRRAFLLAAATTVFLFLTHMVRADMSVSIFTPEGQPTQQFIAGPDGTIGKSVKIGPDRNIWVAIAGQSHGSGSNPDEQIAVFTYNGEKTRVLQPAGGMKNPTSMSWDSGQNVYVTGMDWYTNAPYPYPSWNYDVYKYDSSGDYVGRFHHPHVGSIDSYYDILIAEENRVFVSSWYGTRSATDQMIEFNTDGDTVNTFSPTGSQYFHRDIALSQSDTLWVRMPSNGPGTSLVSEFDLSGNLLSSFSTGGIFPSQSLRGLEMGANGHLYIMEDSLDCLFELDTAGNLVSRTFLSGLQQSISDFTFDPDGNILVASWYSNEIPHRGSPWRSSDVRARPELR